MQLDLNKLVKQTGSPCYVFSEELFHRRIQAVKKAFGNKVNLCFSIKANPFLLEILPKEFTKVEVCSPGELEICKALDISPEKILYSGVNKSRKEIDLAVAYSSSILTVESYNHLRDINASAIEKGIICDILIRITAGSQFGMDKSHVEDIIKNRDKYPGVRIQGIHYFSGTMKRKAKGVIRETEKLINWVAKIKEEFGFVINKIEYGAGLQIAYFDDDPEEVELKLLEEVAPAIRALGEVAELTVEMGRFFAATCGFYITKVIDTKCNEDENYAIMDGGLHQLHYDGQFRGMQLPSIHHIIGEDRAETSIATLENNSWVICGSLCTIADVLAVSLRADDFRDGDYLVFERTGAYSFMEGMAIFLSRDLPKIYILKNNGELLLRRDRFETFIFNKKCD